MFFRNVLQSKYTVCLATLCLFFDNSFKRTSLTEKLTVTLHLLLTIDLQMHLLKERLQFTLYLNQLKYQADIIIYSSASNQRSYQIDLTNIRSIPSQNIRATNFKEVRNSYDFLIIQNFMSNKNFCRSWRDEWNYVGSSRQN